MAEGGLLNKLMKPLIFPISGDMNRRVGYSKVYLQKAKKALSKDNFLSYNLYSTFGSSLDTSLSRLSIHIR
jgi:hypothetical protein